MKKGRNVLWQCDAGLLDAECEVCSGRVLDVHGHENALAPGVDEAGVKW